MAKIKPASWIDKVSNKIGNVVASRGRGGAYIRAKVTPFNPQSTAQVTARANMTQASQGWAGLTDNQRAQWDAAVDQWKSTDIFGDQMTPSGFNLYTQLNLNLLTIGSAMITTPPAKGAVASLTTLAAAQVHGGATTLTFTVTPAPAGSKYIIEASEGMSAGRSFVKSQYRVIEVMAAGQTSPRTVTTVYNAKFGAPGAVGQKVFFRVRPVDSTSGQPGAALTASAIITA